MIPAMGDHLYTLGLLSYPEFLEYKAQSDLCIDYIHNESWMQAYEAFTSIMLHGITHPWPNLYVNSSGCYEYYDFVRMCNVSPSNFDYEITLFSMTNFSLNLRVGPILKPLFRKMKPEQLYMLEICHSIVEVSP